MTLDRVEVDLSRTFEPGQAYVACKYLSCVQIPRRLMMVSVSRARSLDGLKVVSFPPDAQRSADPQVKQFLKETFGLGDVSF